MSETLGEKFLEATMIPDRSFDPRKASLIGLLRYLAAYFQSEAEQTGYGFFCGGDPRKFTPDPECSTEQEQEKWKADCEAWSRGEQVDTSGNVGRWVSENLHIQPGGYGLGTYSYADPYFSELVDALKRHLRVEPRFTLAEIDNLSLHMRKLSVRILEVGHGVGGEASETLGRIAIDVADAACRLQKSRR